MESEVEALGAVHKFGVLFHVMLPLKRNIVAVNRFDIGDPGILLCGIVFSWLVYDISVKPSPNDIISRIAQVNTSA